MRLLLTRPREDAERLAARLTEAGVESVIAPLMRVEFDTARLDLEGVQALLFTSANGVRAFVRANDRRDISVLAVGDATAREAGSAGFTDVESAGGDADALAALAEARLDPEGGALLHVSGHKVAGDLAGRLGAAGFTVRSAALYRAEAATDLPRAAREALETGAVDGVPFFSPRSARTFVTLVERAGLATACAALTGYCLSPAVARVLAERPAVSWRRIEIAAEPTQAALIALIVRADAASN